MALPLSYRGQLIQFYGWIKTAREREWAPGITPRPEQLRPACRLSDRHLLVVFIRMNASIDSRDMKYREPTLVCSTSPRLTRLYSVE